MSQERRLNPAALGAMLTRMAGDCKNDRDLLDFTGVLLSVAARSAGCIPGIRLGELSRVWLADARAARDKRVTLAREIGPMFVDLADAPKEAVQSAGEQAQAAIAHLMAGAKGGPL